MFVLGGWASRLDMATLGAYIAAGAGMRTRLIDGWHREKEYGERTDRAAIVLGPE